MASLSIPTSRPWPRSGTCRSNKPDWRNRFEHFSSGLRITRASDDAAGLGVSETLRAQIRSIDQATRNAGDGISLTQTADGAAASIGSLLGRMRELATQAASGTVGTTERSYLDQEFVALRSEIDRISTTTEFNGQALLSGSSNTFSVFVGFKSGSGNSLSVALSDLDVATVGLTGRASRRRQPHRPCSPTSTGPSARWRPPVRITGRFKAVSMPRFKTLRSRQRISRQPIRGSAMRTSRKKPPCSRGTRSSHSPALRSWPKPMHCHSKP